MKISQDSQTTSTNKRLNTGKEIFFLIAFPIFLNNAIFCKKKPPPQKKKTFTFFFLAILHDHQFISFISVDYC